MPLGPCDKICSNGTEEQCNSCILTQYMTGGEAIKKAHELGKISSIQARILLGLYEVGERLFKIFLGKTTTTATKKS